MTAPCAHTFVDRAREGAIDCVVCLREQSVVYGVFARRNGTDPSSLVELHRDAAAAELRRYELTQQVAGEAIYYFTQLWDLLP